MNPGIEDEPTQNPAEATPAGVRFRLLLQYVGSNYHGWQFQPGLPTVQGALEDVLQRITQRRRPVVGSGRTDRGVHAIGQVASVQLPSNWTAQKLRRALNSLLPPDIWVAQVSVTHDAFHPRFDAIDRTYLYRVGVSEAANSPFQHPWCWPLGKLLDRKLLDDASSIVVGDHSFQAFAKAGQPERGDRCTIHRAGWEHRPGMLHWSVTANRYLHHMVRYLVGTMVDIGQGARPLEDLTKLLEGIPGVTTSAPAPPEGLFLHRVRYADDEEHVRPEDESTAPSMIPDFLSLPFPPNSATDIE